MASVRVYYKKQIRLDTMNLRQEQMFKLGTVGVASIKNRLSAAQGPADTPSKPLSKRYAIKKSRLGLGNRRNLSFTGNMLRNFTVRTVTEKKAKASTTTRKDRIKAWFNNKIEEWCVFSPKNAESVRAAGQLIVNEKAAKLALQRALGGKNV